VSCDQLPSQPHSPNSNVHEMSPATFTSTCLPVINRPLSASSIYYDPWYPHCSIHVPDSLFPQSLSKFSLVYLFAWHPPLHSPHISSSKHCLLFATHAHTIATCFAVVPRLCHLINTQSRSIFKHLLHNISQNS